MKVQQRGKTMSAKKKQTGHSLARTSKSSSTQESFYTPFQGLAQRLIQPFPASRTEMQADAGALSAQLTDVPPGEDELFRHAMSDVVPLDPAQSRRIPPSMRRRVLPRLLPSEEMEVFAHLVDLVSGAGPFELTCSDEYVDGAVKGLSPKILSKLRRGEFSYQDHLDLHGYNREQAQQLVTDFVTASLARGLRCILIVSGRGLNSKQRQPILKEHLVTWLTRSPLKRLVLAFASARAYDGGVGAFYVLLRRGQRKAPFLTPAR
jgi:DNA-nicking Smr family endonuclease